MTALRWATALVTGASSGIGEAFARQLASEGTDLVVVARSAQRLDALRDELEGLHGIDIEVMVADLSDPAERDRVAERVGDSSRPIHLLVNNAGFGTSGRFWELPLEGEDEEVALNVVAVVHLTHAALVAMVSRGAGTVINVASVAGLLPTPGSATYAATKAYLNSFGDSVHEELAGTGVTLTTVLPGFTRTGFQERANVTDEMEQRIPRFMWTTREEVVRETLDGAAAGKARVVPGVVYKGTSATLDLLPRGLIRRAAAAATRGRPL
ncbi:MAG: SDR family oxidoreductase [Microthrixaceae bacterium]|nr:SDR family oxidoreductase [Microthrixaceae bacterium]